MTARMRRPRPIQGRPRNQGLGSGQEVVRENRQEHRRLEGTRFEGSCRTLAQKVSRPVSLQRSPAAPKSGNLTYICDGGGYFGNNKIRIITLMLRRSHAFYSKCQGKTSFVPNPCEKNALRLFLSFAGLSSRTNTACVGKSGPIFLY